MACFDFTFLPANVKQPSPAVGEFSVYLPRIYTIDSRYFRVMFSTQNLYQIRINDVMLFGSGLRAVRKIAFHSFTGDAGFAKSTADLKNSKSFRFTDRRFS